MFSVKGGIIDNMREDLFAEEEEPFDEESVNPVCDGVTDHSGLGAVTPEEGFEGMLPMPDESEMREEVDPYLDSAKGKSFASILLQKRMKERNRGGSGPMMGPMMR